MKTTAKLILCAFAGCAAVSAQATDGSSRITNGGTGFIGVTQSYGQPNAVVAASRISLPAGEASTFVNGRPNQNPEAPSMAMAASTGTNVMGARAMPAASERSAHRGWGTPD
jgi:hypothetical protein